MKNVKVKIFEATSKKELEDYINKFISLMNCEVVDIKIHVDPAIDPKWEMASLYFAMILYTMTYEDRFDDIDQDIREVRDDLLEIKQRLTFVETSILR